MREAYHVLEKKIELIPITVTPAEIKLYKQLAKKGIYICPYCEAQLIVKYGEMKEIHFSHRHSETCLESKATDKAEKKYRKQVERETALHKTIIDIFIDELKVTSKIKPNVSVDYGYRSKNNLKYFPDIYLKINNNEIAISVVTNINSNEDYELAKEIQKRHKHFQENGMHPVWFIESKELALEKEKHSIVLWESEECVALYTKEDKKWEDELKTIATDLSFFNLYNYTPYMDQLKIDVRSLYYVQSLENGIIVSIFRFIKDRNKKPLRSFLLGRSYDISFSRALAINEGRLNLSDPNIDENNRRLFIDRYHELLKEHNENERIRKEHEEKQRMELRRIRQLEEQQRREEDLKRKLEEYQRREKEQKRKIEEKQKREEMQKNLIILLEKGKVYLANIPFENISETELWSIQFKLINDFKNVYMKGKSININLDEFTFRMEQLIAEQFAATKPLREAKLQEMKEALLTIIEKELNKINLEYLKKNSLHYYPYILIPLFEDMLKKLNSHLQKNNRRIRATDLVERSDIGECLNKVINEREEREKQEFRLHQKQEQQQKNRLCDEIVRMQQIDGVNLVANVDELRIMDLKKLKETHQNVLKLYERKTRLSLF